MWSCLWTGDKYRLISCSSSAAALWAGSDRSRRLLHAASLEIATHRYEYMIKTGIVSESGLTGLHLRVANISRADA